MPAAAGSACSVVSTVLLGALPAILLSGCQTYEPKSLDLASHREAFLARTPDSPDVAAYAQQLRESSPSAPTTFDLADGISSAEGEAIALVFNAELRVARLRAGVTQATAANAGLWEDPTIGVDVTRIIQSTPEPWKVFSSIGFTLPISGRLEVEKARAGLEHAAALARVAQDEWRIRMELRRTWTRWSSLEAQVGAVGELVAGVDRVLAVVDKMEAAGEISRTEARLFRIDRATQLAELAQIESAREETTLRMRQLMGLAPHASVRFTPSGFETRALVAADRESLEARSPRLLVSTAEYEVAEKALLLEIRKQYPDLHIGPGYGREDGQDQVLLGLSAPLPIFNANRQAIAEALARRDLARATAETTLEALLAELRLAEVRLEAASRQRRTLEVEIVPLVDAQYADARQVAQLGEVNTLILLDSLTRQQAAKVRLIEARRNEALASIDLDDLLGPEPAAAPETSIIIDPTLPPTSETAPS